MSDVRFDDPAAFPHVFELSNNGSASVLEATAVAAGSIRETGRRVVVVADIGGGTSDFGAFMTRLRGKDVLAEIRDSSGVLREAGDHLDMLLTRHILDDAGIDREDPAGRGAANRLRVDQRANKEPCSRTARLSSDLVMTFELSNRKPSLPTLACGPLRRGSDRNSARPWHLPSSVPANIRSVSTGGRRLRYY
jgi:hypothetical protein